MKFGQRPPAGARKTISFLRPLLEGPEAGLRLTNSRSGLVVAHQLLTAFDSASRRTGLLHHDSLSDGCALLIAPSNAIHTFFMRFEIDVAFVKKDGRVLKTRHVLRPWRLAGALGAFVAIELPAGALARSDTRPGDTLVITRQ